MAIFERGETYVHRTDVRTRAGLKTNVSSVSLSIYDPCGFRLANSVSMTSDATGEYFYNYSLSSTATYGRYKTTTTATSAGGQKSIVQEQFYVMPWKLEKSIRRVTGASDTKSMSDDDLSHIAWMSYIETLRDIYGHHYAECPLGNPDTGTCFDGSNKSFQTPSYPIADISGDGVVTGYGQQSCGTDVNFWWINSAGSRQQGYCTVNKANNGEITLTQSSGAAVPSNNEGVYLEYWTEYNTYNSFILEQAVTYLAAHYVTLRFAELDKVTLADIRDSNPLIVINPKRFKDEYYRKIDFIRPPLAMGVA